MEEVRNCLAVVSKLERKMKIVLISILCAISLVQYVSAIGLSGEFSEEKPATLEIEEFVKEV